MSWAVEKLAFTYCAETCPDVDRAFDKAVDELNQFLSEDDASDAKRVLDKLCEQVKKVGTEKLRDALREAVSDKLDAESERDDFIEQVRDLESQVASLKDEVADLSRQLDEVSV